MYVLCIKLRGIFCFSEFMWYSKSYMNWICIYRTLKVNYKWNKTAYLVYKLYLLRFPWIFPCYSKVFTLFHFVGIFYYLNFVTQFYISNFRLGAFCFICFSLFSICVFIHFDMHFIIFKIRYVSIMFSLISYLKLWT